MKSKLKSMLVTKKKHLQKSNTVVKIRAENLMLKIKRRKTKIAYNLKMTQFKTMMM